MAFYLQLLGKTKTHGSRGKKNRYSLIKDNAIV